MRLKEGYQTCPLCSGKGCYRCEKKGYLLMCPACNCTEYISEVGKNFRCIPCGTMFGKAGNIINPADL